MQRFDYIINGAGASGLSLLMHMIRSGEFSGKKILLLEKDRKTVNDRTWCFWEKEPGLFENIIYRSWDKMWFHGNRSALHDIAPYKYKLIRGIDFYNYCFKQISGCDNIEVRYGNVERCVSNGVETYVVFEGARIFSEYIFNSILFDKPELDDKQYYLLQHFKGWEVRTKMPVFSPDEATLMDFRVKQDRGTAFVYVMPFADSRALVEYTLFSDKLLQGEEYDLALRKYCQEFLGLKGFTDYVIEATEFGVIPMTNYRFPVRNNNIINIGTAGGQTKASSGYTFKFIQKQSAAIVGALARTGKPYISSGNSRFQFYDSILLNILSNNKLPGKSIFNTLFESNSMPQIFQFLDNETSLLQDLNVIRKLPKRVFMKSAMQQLF